MSRAGRAAGLALLACCLGLAAYLGVWALDESTRRGETVELALRPAPTAAPMAPPDTTGLELNGATLEQLMELPGIGEHLAKEIIRQRELHPFYFVEDLKAVPGIGDRRLESLRPLVWVSPPPAESPGDAGRP